MGDIGIVQAEDPTAALSELEPITVLVTGFGPFKDNLVNASHLVASHLPKEITAIGKTGAAGERTVQIHAHPTPFPVSYHTVRTLLPRILDDFALAHNGKRPDLTVHIGIAPNRQWYSVETRAFRDNYRITDVDEKLGYEDGEKIWKEKGFPTVLYPGPVDPSRAVKEGGGEEATNASLEGKLQVTPFTPNRQFLLSWKSYAPAGADLRISDDAGRYLCEFIFYSSLALAYEERRPQSVTFLHIPAATDDASLELGSEVAVALIKSMVSSWIDEA